MDNSLIFKKNNDENIKLDSSALNIDDNVLVHKSSEEYYVHGKSSFNIGDEVLIFQNPENGEFYCVNNPIQDISVKITDGFNRNVSSQYEVVDLGIFSFQWSGSGKVYIMSDCNASLASDRIWADDILTLSTSKGTVSHNFNNNVGLPLYRTLIYYSPALNITGILQKGANMISATITDTLASQIGCCALYLVQVD